MGNFTYALLRLELNDILEKADSLRLYAHNAYQAANLPAPDEIQCANSLHDIKQQMKVLQDMLRKLDIKIQNYKEAP